MSKCEYCVKDKYVELNRSNDCDRIKILVNALDEELRVRVYGEDGLPMMQGLFEIKYCPMCGRKFW